MSKEMDHLNIGDENFEVVDRVTRRIAEDGTFDVVPTGAIICVDSEDAIPDGYELADDMYNEEITELMNDVDVLESRVDEIIALPDGSTTADAELVDIRVGFDSKTYTSAGNAVRGQVSDLNTIVNNFASEFGTIINIYASGEYTVTNGGDVLTGIQLVVGRKYAVFSSITTNQLYIYNYNSVAGGQTRHSLVSGHTIITASYEGIVISGNGTFTAGLKVVDLTAYPDVETNIELFTYSNIADKKVAVFKKYVVPSVLSDDIFQNFIQLTDEYYHTEKSISVSRGVASSSFIGNDFTFTASDDDPYWTLTYKLFSGKKYALYYDVVSNNNFSFKFKLYNNAWVQTLASATQTANVHATGTVFVDITATGNFSFDSISIASGSVVEGTVKIYDITNAPENALTFDYSTLDTDVFALNINYSEESASDTHLVNKKVVFYGDSITAQNKYPLIVKNYYGFTMVNASSGGARISYNTSNDMSSDTRLEALPSDADIVVIMGGTNDWGKTQIEQTLSYNNGFDRTKFKGGLAYIIQKIQIQCPNAKVIVATLIGGRNETRAEGQTPVVQYLPETDQYGQTDLDFRNAEIEVANLLNIPVCDTWSCGINGNNACSISGGVVTSGTIADTVHPTNAGAKMIADYIIGYLKSVQFSD